MIGSSVWAWLYLLVLLLVITCVDADADADDDNDDDDDGAVAPAFHSQAALMSTHGRQFYILQGTPIDMHIVS